MELLPVAFTQLDLDAVQGLMDMRGRRKEMRLGWVRQGGTCAFTHQPLSLDAFATSVVALRAMARGTQLEKSNAESNVMRGALAGLKAGRLLFRGCNAIVVCGGVGGDVVLRNMEPYQDSGSYITCLRGLCRLGATSLPVGHMVFMQPCMSFPALRLVGDTSVVLCLSDRELALSDTCLPQGLHGRFSVALRAAERVRSNARLQAWRRGGDACIMKRPSCRVEIRAPESGGRAQVEQQPRRKRMRQKSAGVALARPRASDSVERPMTAADIAVASHAPADAATAPPSLVDDVVEACQTPVGRVASPPSTTISLADLADALSTSAHNVVSAHLAPANDVVLAQQVSVCSNRCQTLHRVLWGNSPQPDLFWQSIRSFSPEFEQIIWHLSDFALPWPIANVVLRDARPILLDNERKWAGRESDVVLSLVKMRILFRYGGWMCDPDVLWLGRFCKVPGTARPLALVSSVFAGGETTISECFMAGAQYAAFWGICASNVQTALRSGMPFAGLGECIRQAHLNHPFDVVILEPAMFCPLAPAWRAVGEDDSALDQLLGCAVKVWPEWPVGSVRVVVARCLSERGASRLWDSDVVRLLCETRAAIRGAQRDLECAVCDVVSVLEWLGISLRLLDSLRRDVITMSLPWGPRFLACAVLELALGRATFAAPSEFGVAGPFPDIPAIRNSILANASHASFHEYRCEFLSKFCAE